MPKVIRSKPRYLAQLTHWPTDSSQLQLFAGPSLNWPLTVEQLQQSEANAWAGMLVEGSQLLGYFQLKFKGPGCCRLCRVIIHPRYRRRGLGRMMLAQALIIAREQCRAVRVELGVYQHNVSALSRYRYFGFHPTRSHPVQGPGTQSWVVVEMCKLLGKSCIDIQI